MRTQAERDEQTVDIMSAILVAGLVWGLPLIPLAVLVHAAGADEAFSAVALVAAAGFAATVVRRLR